MIELVVTLCLAAAPAECRTERIPFDGNAVACVLFGQQAAAAHLMARPAWRLKRYRCGPAEIAT